MEVLSYIEPKRINQDAIEGICRASHKPELNELCSYMFGKKNIVFRLVYRNRLNRQKYWCRFERADWK